MGIFYFTLMISAVSIACCINSSIFSERFNSDFSIRSRFGFVTGCFATKIVQQSSNGCIDVSYVSIFSEISTISLLSNPINGRYTGSVTNRIRCRKTLHSLACNLSDTFSGDQSETAVFFRKMLCNLHHITPHDDRQFLMWTFLIYIKLNVCKIHHMKFDRTCILRNQFCQIYYFFLCSFTCIRRCVEIRCFQFHPTFRNHISRNRAVNPTGKEQHRASIRSTGIPPGPGMISEYK